MRISGIRNIILLALLCTPVHAQQAVDSLLKECGKFEKWRVVEIEESPLLGGDTKYIYKLSEGDTLKGNTVFGQRENDLLAPCNIMANIIGIVKSSNSVFPERRGDGYCARMEVVLERVKVIGMINISALAQGTILTGSFIEPIRNTQDPYSKFNCGIPYTSRPKALKYDYKSQGGKEIIRATGLSPKKHIGGKDYPYIGVVLQKRYEDEKGNVHALRVGTGFKIFYEDAPEWVNGETIEILYGDITSHEGYTDFMGLKNGDSAYYCLNSKGRSVPILEEGWADADDTPTHAIVWISSSCGKAFYGGLGNKFWIDNVEFVF